METKISHKIIEQLEKDKITPTSVYYFSSVKFISWFSLLLITIFGSLSFATTLFILYDQDYDIFLYLDKSSFEYFLSVIPYLWVGVIILISIICWFLFKETKNGYKYNYFTVIFGSVLLSMVFGYFIWLNGFGNVIHHRLIKDLPWYQTQISSKDINWLNPEKGLLSGNLQKISPNQLQIVDMNKKVWMVNVTQDLLDDTPVLEGRKLKFVGELEDDGSFTAEEIRYWHED